MAYVKGRAFEYQIKKKLIKDGYTVFRFAGSKPLDLLALRNGKILFCECKTYTASTEDRKKVGEWSAILGFPVCLFQKSGENIAVEVFEPKHNTGKNIYEMLGNFLQFLLDKYSQTFPNDDGWINLSQLDTSKAIWAFLHRSD